MVGMQCYPFIASILFASTDSSNLSEVTLGSFRGTPSFIHLARVVQRLDNAIHWINHYAVDKCQENKPRYPLDSDLSGG